MNDATISLCRLFERDRPDHLPVCIDAAGETTSWLEFRQDVARYRDVLARTNARRWALDCRDSYWFAIGLFALLQADRVPILLPNWRPGTLELFADEYDALIGDQGARADIALGPTPSEAVIRERFHALDPERAQLMIFTSGSTGEPKGIRKQLRQLEAEVRDLDGLWGARIGTGVVLSTVSHQHIYGLLFRLLWPLAARRCFLRLDLGFPEQCVKAIREHDRPLLVSSPALLKRLSADCGIPTPRQAPALVFSSGGHLPSAAARLCREVLKVWPTEVLGSTETGGIGWRQEPAQPGVWRRFPSVRLSLSDDSRLTVRSPYLDSATPWVMGDRGMLINEHEFRLLGRADRIVKIEERRVSLPELEHHLNNCDLIDSNAMLALNDGGRQAIACVAVLNSAGAQGLRAQGKRTIVQLLRAHLKRNFELPVVPRRYRFVDHLPVNAQGKVVHSELKVLFGDSTPDPIVQSVTADGALLNLVLRVPAELLYLKGHFSGAPILPGVVQIDWAIRLARKYGRLSGDFQKMENVKFKTIIRPEAVLNLVLETTPDQRRLRFEYRSSNEIHSCGRVYFRPASRT